MPKIITIIGSRLTPQRELDFTTAIAQEFAGSGWILRSGAAKGMDKAGEAGFDKGIKEIYLPWRGFDGHTSPLIAPDFPNWEVAVKLMLYLHPNAAAVKQKQSLVKLLARDVYQILGADLATPSDLVLCWTPGGELIGGTALALRVCSWYQQETGKEIPIINIGALGIEASKEKLAEYLEE